MRSFKRIFSVLLAGAMALAVLAGCSQASSSYTISGSVTLRQNGETAVAGAPITIVADGGKTYITYEAQGYTFESLSDASSYYSRAYATGTTGTKWHQSALDTSSTAASSDAKTGTLTLDGVEYTTVTYDDINFYCYQNDNLAAIYAKTGAEETIIKIGSISAEADASLLKTPDASEIESAA